MRKMKMMNFNITKLFALFLGLFLVMGTQITNADASSITTVNMGTNITMTLDGEENNDLSNKKVIRAVKSSNSSEFYTKGAGKTSFPIVDGTYELYDLTNKEINNTVHNNLLSNGTLEIKDGKVTENAKMEFFTVSVYDDENKNKSISYQEILKGNKAVEVEKPERKGYTFIEWVDDEGNKFDFNEPITESKVVYPKWEKKYAILVVAGQSNAVGYDESKIMNGEIGKLYTENDRIKQLGLYEDDNLDVIELGATAQNFQDMRKFGARGIQLPLGNLLLDYIPEDYDIVIIPAAFGGSGFTTGDPVGEYDSENLRPKDYSKALKWGVDTPYYKTMRDRVAYMLDKNPDNYYIGTVWCQGEFDNSKPDEQYVKFKEMTDAFFKYFNENYKDRVGEDGGVAWSEDQWFIYETVPYWSNMSGVKEIFDNYQKWSPNTYVDINFGNNSAEYTNQTNGANATKNGNVQTSSILQSHYGNGAFAKLVAPEVIKVMEEAGAITKTEN